MVHNPLGMGGNQVERENGKFVNHQSSVGSQLMIKL